MWPGPGCQVALSLHADGHALRQIAKHPGRIAHAYRVGRYIPRDHASALIIAFSPMMTLERIVAPDPIEAPRLTQVCSTFQSFSVRSCPAAVVARG